MTEDEIYKAALEKWGHGFQIGMAMTEAGELIAALGRFVIQNRNNTEEVIDELADMEIMLCQMRYLFGEGKINDRKEQKLLRLRALVQGGADK